MSESLPDIYPNSIGDDAYQDFGSLISKYGDPDSTLHVYLGGLGFLLKQVDDISRDGPNGEPGWSQIFDLQRAKTEWLPWTGQLVGYHVPVRPDTQTLAEYDAQQRERIVTRSAHRRGSVPLLEEVIAEQLDVPKRIKIHERYALDPYLIKLWVWLDDIATSEAEVERAALAQKVAGLIMVFSILDGAPIYDLLDASNNNYAQVSSKHATYASVLANPGL